MKRHAAIAPFSRDHHEALITAQLIKKDAPNYRGLPETIEGKKEYVIRYYDLHLKDHFSKEESILFNLSRNIDSEIDLLMDELIVEHRLIESLIEKLSTDPQTETLLDQLGKLMESHIRQEERILFQLLQEKLPPGKFKEIEDRFV
jgi:iron-sulfur cluster repair protein YtfE (RIC family)